MTSILRSDTGRPALAVPDADGHGVKENYMSRSTKPAVKITKSDRFRALLLEGKTVAEIVKATGEGYPFVYGVAKKTTNPATGTSFAATAASRRATKVVSMVGDVVEIRLDSGKITRVNVKTGAVKTTAK